MLFLEYCMNKIPLVLFILISFAKVNAQNFPYCKTGLFSEQTYYGDISIEHDLDIVYGANLDYQGNNQDLKLDIHYPNLLIDPLPLRPMIVMIHGGGFYAGSKNDMTTYCTKLARAGYVAVSIDYRVGWNYIGGGSCSGNIPQLKYAMYRALQDTKAAIRYLVSKANNYRIDTGYIYLAGQSEGGMTAMNCAYMNQAEADTILPGAFADLGSIDSATNNYYNTFTLKGIFNWCGAVMDTNMIQHDTDIPLLSVHGLLDSVMPAEYGKYLNCQNVNNPYPDLYGPKSIYKRMKNTGICSEANFDANGEHCFFPSLEENVYIPAKFTCFFKNLMCGNCTTESKVSYNQKSCVESAPVSTIDMNEALPVEIYPNPVAGSYFNISFTLKKKTDIKIELTDMTGAEVLVLVNEKLYTGIFNKSFTISKYLPKGVYLLKMNFGNDVSYRKIIF